MEESQASRIFVGMVNWANILEPWLYGEKREFASDSLVGNICGNEPGDKLHLWQMMCHANCCFVAGSLHCVACSDQGEVFTWGDNDEGQLGDGTTSAIPIPRLVVALQVTGIFSKNKLGNFWPSWDRALLIYSFKYNEQDVTLYNILYCCKCSTCFRRFLRLKHVEHWQQ